MARRKISALVLDNSFNGPVVVFFWSPKAGPCLRLLPRLVKLSDEYAGSFLLVLYDTDKHSRFVRDQGVYSIPTVRVYRHRQIVETIRGAYSEEVLRRAIEAHLNHTPASLRRSATQELEQGATQRALELLDEAATGSPYDHRIRLDQAKLLMRSGRRLRRRTFWTGYPQIPSWIPSSIYCVHT
ncbi:MAG: thioredoxin domain-containing protein [Gammaproteobacteria bacterium]|nr:thioredoxin domain-containing protein [Gammaproteobacteria bacterium]